MEPIGFFQPPEHYARDAWSVGDAAELHADSPEWESMQHAREVLDSIILRRAVEEREVLSDPSPGNFKADIERPGVKDAGEAFYNESIKKRCRKIFNAAHQQNPGLHLEAIEQILEGTIKLAQPEIDGGKRVRYSVHAAKAHERYVREADVPDSAALVLTKDARKAFARQAYQHVRNIQRNATRARVNALRLEQPNSLAAEKELFDEIVKLASRDIAAGEKPHFMEHAREIMQRAPAGGSPFVGFSDDRIELLVERARLKILESKQDRRAERRVLDRAYWEARGFSPGAADVVTGRIVSQARSKMKAGEKPKPAELMKLVEEANAERIQSLRDDGSQRPSFNLFEQGKLARQAARRFRNRKPSTTVAGK